MNLKFFLEREIGKRNNNHELYDLRNSDYLIRKLDLDKKLEVHKGCVNSISWSDDGYYILSGSDDQYLKITNVFDNNDITSIRTPHTSNIFCARFLPESNNNKLISCSSNGGLFYTSIDDSSKEPKFSQFKCHGNKTCFELRTIQNEPHVFLSCGKDGTVKLFDLRIKSKCESEFCDEDTLIRLPIGITSMAMCPSAPHIVCGGIDGILRFYDRRFLNINSCKLENDNCDHSLFSLFNYYDYLNTDESKKRITSIQYSKDGTDLLVNYQPGNLILLDWKKLSFNENNTKIDTHQTINKPSIIKKFRIQSSWNDTGPDSRPSTEASTSSDNTRNRFVNFVDNWLEQRTNNSSNITSNTSNTETNETVSKTKDLSSSLNKTQPTIIEEEESNLESIENKKKISPAVKMVYTGHRNIRTIIKESNFWGSKFVCSGSDCGHVFFWNKENGKIVNVLEADKHVVNCVQENPIIPILASSGIDYNIKIWEPKLNEINDKNEKIEELTNRNKLIIEEQKETITIPLRFLIPALRLFRQNNLIP